MGLGGRVRMYARTTDVEVTTTRATRMARRWTRFMGSRPGHVLTAGRNHRPRRRPQDSRDGAWRLHCTPSGAPIRAPDYLSLLSVLFRMPPMRGSVSLDLTFCRAASGRPVFGQAPVWMVALLSVVQKSTTGIWHSQLPQKEKRDSECGAAVYRGQQDSFIDSWGRRSHAADRRDRELSLRSMSKASDSGHRRWPR